ncbi:MAG: hypothetical protein ACLFPN_02135 [Methanomassiliicoccales archaeon]
MRSEDDPVDDLDGRIRSDRQVLRIFSALALSLTFILGAFGLLRPVHGGTQLLIDELSLVLSGLILSLLITGTLVFLRHHRARIVPNRRIARCLVLLSAILGGVLTLFLAAAERWYPDLPAGTDTLGLAGTFIAGTLGVMVTLLIFMMLGFGLMGVLAALQRRIAPPLLLRIREMEQGERDWGDLVISWIFSIPPYLDPSTLTVEEVRVSATFPRGRFLRAVGWEFFFALLLASFISLNPLLMELLDLDQLFVLLSTASYFVPMLIIPWFIYLGMRARIQGVIRDFHLYDGVRSRLFQTVGAIGTALVFVRLALEEVNAVDLAFRFAGFFITFLVISIMFTFIYFNYFDDELASDVREGYRRSVQEMRIPQETLGGRTGLK